MRTWIMFLFVIWLRLEHGELFPLGDKGHGAAMGIFLFFWVAGLLFDIHEAAKARKS